MRKTINSNKKVSAEKQVDGVVASEKREKLLHLDCQVCFPLYAAANLFTRLYRPLLAKIGLTYPQYLVMLILWEFEMQSVSELGEKLHLDSGTLTPLLKRLEKADLLVRKRDESDERRVLVSLTAKGRKLRASAVKIPPQILKKLNLRIEDVEDLRQSVQSLINILCSKLSNKNLNTTKEIQK